MKLKLLALLFFGLLFSSVKSQTIYVRQTDGSQISYPVASIQKLTFSGGNVIGTTTAGLNAPFALIAIRYISFTDFTLGTNENELVKNSFCLFPNPVSNIVNITNQDQTQIISRVEIISLQGRLLFEQTSLSTITPQLDLTSLPEGMYFCKITSNNKTQTIKFLKQ